MKVTDLTRQRFGRLRVVEFAGSRHVGARFRLAWLCVCDCGATLVALGENLKRGNTVSCGCSKQTHGMTGTPEFSAWHNIWQRCSNPSNRRYSTYGGRGIGICERWRSFEKFFADMGSRPSPKHTLDRIDNDKGYDPSNCRWATNLEQAQNTTRSRKLAHDGRVQSVATWARETQIPETTIRGRLGSGWPIDLALSEPPDRNRPRGGRGRRLKGLRDGLRAAIGEEG